MDDRRRCQRFDLNVPVRVYGRSPRNIPFRAMTATLTVSKFGGLLDMKPRVKLGQKMLIVNSFTEEERECRVVYVDAKSRGGRRVAVEFTSSTGDFWHVYSPPARLEVAHQQADVMGALANT